MGLLNLPLPVSWLLEFAEKAIADLAARLEQISQNCNNHSHECFTSLKQILRATAGCVVTGSEAMKSRWLPSLQQLKQDLKNDLIAGVLVVIPLATTIWLTLTIASWVIVFLTRIPSRLSPFDGLNPLLVNLLNLAVGFAVPLGFILLIGLMARNIAGRWLLDTGERTLESIPFAGVLYKTLKQLLETLLKDSGNRFRRVVLVEYPRAGIWSLAFVTGAISGEVQSHFSGSMLSLFIPTSPNPTTGWYAIVPEDQVIDLAMPVEDAFKVIISGGIVTPDLTVPAPLPPATRPSLDSGFGQPLPDDVAAVRLTVDREDGLR